MAVLVSIAPEMKHKAVPVLNDASNHDGVCGSGSTAPHVLIFRAR
jgi:hypothetical protein